MTIDDAIAAFTTRSAPGLAAKLRGLANAQLDLELDNPAHIGPRASTEDPDSARPTDYVPGPGPDDRLPKDQTSTRAVRPWVPEFLSNGTVPRCVIASASSGRRAMPDCRY
ncbi:hypothetical protein [Nocardia sp. IFM 10818]